MSEPIEKVIIDKQVYLTLKKNLGLSQGKLYED